MALAVVVLGLARPIGDLGIGSAIVQRAELTERHVRTGFTFLTLWGLTVAAAIVAAAPWSAVVVRDPRGAPLLPVLAPRFWVGGPSRLPPPLFPPPLHFST